MKFMSQEFLDAQVELAKTLPVRVKSISMQYVISGTPGGDVQFNQYWDRGILVKNVLGWIEAEATITITYPDFVAIYKGDLNNSQAFMQGKVKIRGDVAKVLSLLPLTNSPEYKKWERDQRTTLTVEFP